MKNITILFSGNSGDGIQFIGKQFSDTSVFIGNSISTLTDFPSEIRPPRNTLEGLSGFKIHFGNEEIKCTEDYCDVLVVTNAISLKKNLNNLKIGGIIIADNSGFSLRELKIANYSINENPLKTINKYYKIYEYNFLLETNNILKIYKYKDIKNIYIIRSMFMLGFIYHIYSYPTVLTENFIKKKFHNDKNILNINLKILKYGYAFGVKKNVNNKKLINKKKVGCYKIKNLNGNQAISLGLIYACKKAKIDLFYSGYPITPASDILNILSKYKKFGVKTFQAEDEIAAVTSCIGASYAGNIGVTATSGPGMSLKQEGINLAVILEIPLLIINVQRVGPSTGIPTKTEQSDLMQAIYGRNGESPLPILSAHSPINCFYMAFNAIKIAIEHMTPVILLSESNIANGYESWIPIDINILPEINISNIEIKNKDNNDCNYYPYQRNHNNVRPWIKPGTKNHEHIIGSLEKENITGNVSYDPINHENMTKLRQNKIDKISNFIPEQIINLGEKRAELVILSWGGTYGIIYTATKNLINQGFSVAHIHLDYIYPLPNKLYKLLIGFKKVLIAELNNKQLYYLIRSKFLIDTFFLNKIQGIPFTIQDIIDKVKSII